MGRLGAKSCFFASYPSFRRLGPAAVVPSHMVKWTPVRTRFCLFEMDGFCQWPFPFSPRFFPPDVFFYFCIGFVLGFVKEWVEGKLIARLSHRFSPPPNTPLSLRSHRFFSAAPDSVVKSVCYATPVLRPWAFTPCLLRSNFYVVLSFCVLLVIIHPDFFCPPRVRSMAFLFFSIFSSEVRLPLVEWTEFCRPPQVPISLFCTFFPFLTLASHRHLSHTPPGFFD